MRIGVPSPSVSYFPAVVAWKKCFFSQEGIQAEFIVMKPSIIPAALTNGEIHFSTATGTVVGVNANGKRRTRQSCRWSGFLISV
jgi:ABC-type nitrate/sulfonate/bicarbonate transport system substrate-binding protein